MVIAQRVSLDEFLAMEETKPYRELIDGEVVEKAMPNLAHSTLVLELGSLLVGYLRESREGRAGTELRFVDRAEGRGYLPDLSVLSTERAARVHGSDPVELPPDLAIEVLSPEDRTSRVLEKVQFYLRSGVKIIWVVDPEGEAVMVYRPGAEPQRLTAPSTLDARPVLRDFTVDLAQLFAVLHEDDPAQ